MLPGKSIPHHALAGVFLLLWSCVVSPVFGEEKVVRVWHTESQPRTVQVMNDIARRFEAAHPGIKIETEALVWSELEGRIAAALAAGLPPELSHGQPITCAALHATGQILPLDEVVEAIGPQNVSPLMKRLGQFDGHQYGLSHAVATSLLVYRKDMAERLGVAEPHSWTDLLAAADTLTQDINGDGRTDVYGVNLPGDNLFVNIILGELIRANGGALFDKANRPLITDRKMIETLEFLQKLLVYALPGWQSQTYQQSYQNFISGKSAILLSGYGRGAGLIERTLSKEMVTEQKFGVWIKPHGPSGSSPAAQIDGEPWMLFKESKHPKEAIEFLKFFYRDENYLDYVATVPIHLLPITLSLRRSDTYQHNGMLQRWKSWIDVQQIYLDNDYAKPTLVTEWSDLTEKPYLLDVLNSGILRDMVMDVAIERQDPKAAAERAQKRLEVLLQSVGHSTAPSAGDRGPLAN
jgi:multiple sugar transport system substrate-binding protein